MLRKKNHHTHNHHDNREAELEDERAESGYRKKKKIHIFYKINFFLGLFVSLILLYFIILVSAKPKSFPYITKKIESYLQENFSRDTQIENSYISFTPYGSFKILVKNVRVNKSDSSSAENQFEVPQIEGEFPLYNVLLMHFVPSKVRIIDPVISLYSKQNSAVAADVNLGAAGAVDANASIKNADVQTKADPSVYLSPIIAFLSAIRNDKLRIKSFDLENLQLFIKKENAADIKILLKKSLIKVEAKNRNSDEALQISSVNVVNFKDGKDINLGANCKFDKDDVTVCNLALSNLASASISSLSPIFKAIDQFNFNVNALASLTIKDQKIQSLTFQADAKNGYFDLPQFFSKKINFANLSVKGSYDNENDNLNLSNIEADLEPIAIVDTAATSSEEKKRALLSKENHLMMSLLIKNLQNLDNKNLDFAIKLQNVATNKLEAFWPLQIEGQDIRKWVIDHINSGVIGEASANFSLSVIDGTVNLSNITSAVYFSGLNLSYDEFFPQIGAMKGVANFSKNSMVIKVESGNVLSSKVSDVRVSIDDFASKVNILNISGNLVGDASDGVKHADYKSSFATQVAKYLNGNSNANFVIKIPLLETINLRDIYISTNQNIAKLQNEYLAGDVSIQAFKDFNSDNFAIKADLTKAEISAKYFDIEKKSQTPSSLDFNMLVGNKDLKFQNINLSKSEEVADGKKTKIVNAKISGDFAIETSNFGLVSLNLKNKNFGKNDYSFSYKDDGKLQKISVVGGAFNLASFLENKSPLASSSASGVPLALKVNLDKVFLHNKKSLNRVAININYANGSFYNSFAKASYSKQQFVDLANAPKAKDGASLIAGSISDLGYLAEGFNIADTISGGNAKIKIGSKMVEKAAVFEGEIVVDDGITFYENAATKRFAKDNLFSTIKDSIFSSNKTTFNSLKTNLKFSKNNLEIISLVANNYKIGITAKGFVNLANDTYDIKGMIIPGFVINNLFGIGKIPLIGGVISAVLTGGEGGGIFGIKYQYKKLVGQKEASFETSKVSAFVPVSIRNLFEAI